MTHDFHGFSTRSLANQHLRVDYLAEAGPRLVRLSLTGSEVNLMAEVPDLSLETPFGDFYLYGGHRLWHAPEAFPRTYLPDNDGLTIDEFEGGVRLRQPTERATSIQKSIELRLEPDRPALVVQHSLHNVGLWPVELAPWALTQVALGGVAVLPQQAPVPSTYLPTRPSGPTRSCATNGCGWTTTWCWSMAGWASSPARSATSTTQAGWATCWTTSSSSSASRPSLACRIPTWAATVRSTSGTASWRWKHLAR